MANVGEVLETCLIKDMVNESGHVFETEITLPVVPVGTIVLREAQVTLTEVVATIVAEPNIVAFTGEEKSVGFLGVIKNILHHVGIEGVHK